MAEGAIGPLTVRPRAAPQALGPPLLCFSQQRLASCRCAPSVTPGLAPSPLLAPLTQQASDPAPSCPLAAAPRRAVSVVRDSTGSNSAAAPVAVHCVPGLCPVRRRRQGLGHVACQRYPGCTRPQPCTPLFLPALPAVASAIHSWCTTAPCFAPRSAACHLCLRRPGGSDGSGCLMRLGGSHGLGFCIPHRPGG